MKTYHRVIRYLILFILNSIPIWLGIISCRLPLQVYSTPTPAPRNAWLVEWLEEPVCQPPCFLGITPGTTTMTETIRLLSGRPDVQIRRDPIVSSDHQELSWDFTTRTPNDGGRLNTDEKGKAVSFIDLGIGSDQYLLLSEIIKSFGSPDHVYIPFCPIHDRCEVHLIYTTAGMVLDNFLPAEENKDNKYSVDISPDIRIEEIWFITPGEDGYRDAFGFWANDLSDSQSEWNGYTIYLEK